MCFTNLKSGYRSKAEKQFLNITAAEITFDYSQKYQLANNQKNIKQSSKLSVIDVYKT